MPTNLEIYQLLQEEDMALTKAIGDLRDYVVSCVGFSATAALNESIENLRGDLEARRDKVRAMLKRFKVLYRIKAQYRFYLGLDKESSEPFFEKSHEH